MKTTIVFSRSLILSLIILPALLLAQPKKSLKSEFKTLGDNQDVVDRVKNLDSHQKVRIVQNRLVDRNNRLEIAVNYAFNGGGDSYVKTENAGGLIEFHINPRWSIGAHYQKSYNTFTPEGETQINNAEAEQKKDHASTYRFPALDFPLETTMATISYYPIYGKLNLFDSGIAQFDIYGQLGYGQIKLGTGTSDLLSLGLGSGVWLNSRITTRLEVRYQQYEDLLLTDRRKQNHVQAVASLGVLLW